MGGSLCVIDGLQDRIADSYNLDILFNSHSLVVVSNQINSISRKGGTMGDQPEKVGAGLLFL